MRAWWLEKRSWGTSLRLSPSGRCGGAGAVARGLGNGAGMPVALEGVTIPAREERNRAAHRGHAVATVGRPSVGGG